MHRLILIAALAVSTAGFAAQPLQPAGVDSLIAASDAYSLQTFENQKSLDVLMKAYAADSTNYEVLWRISRAYSDIGEILPTVTQEQKTKQLDMYEKSLDFAERAVKANPNGTMGYTRRAIATGRVALFKGVWDSIDLVKEVRADCEKAIDLDKSNPAAYYVLGRTHAKLCEKPKIIRWPLGLSWANYDDAKANYEKAIALRPTFIMYRLDAARAYVEVDEYDKAKTELTRIATLPTENQKDNDFRKEAKELLEEIKDK
ncbi:MAG TPA: tetratricopeptide repeat protein [Bacteroidota bacterium]|nr:tetratricopeptide repeat protein [Bacteroidota bacterium]